MKNILAIVTIICSCFLLPIRGQVEDEVAKKLSSLQAQGAFTDAQVLAFSLRTGATILNTGIGKREDVFDLASLSKFYTAFLTLKLVNDDLLNLDDELGDFFKNIPADKRGISVSDLLTHSSGLISSYLVKDLRSSRADKVAQRLLRYSLRQKDQEGFLYSDTNFTMLSLIIQKVTGTSLKKYLGETLSEFKNTYVYKVPRGVSFIKSHGDLKFQGRTHDPRARVYKKGAGHAGVFANIDDVGLFIKMLFSKNGRFADIGQIFIDGGNKLRSLGLDRSSRYSQALRGDCMAASQTLSHTGFTGTSILVDHHNEVAVVILTNRSVSKLGKESFKKIKELRKYIGQKVCEAI